MQDGNNGMAPQRQASASPRSPYKGTQVLLSLKVTQSGSVSLCGFGRFPVTLSKDQWIRLLGMSDEILAFIAANEGHLPPDD